jgi:myosin heavy subunit
VTFLPTPDEEGARVDLTTQSSLAVAASLCAVPVAFLTETLTTRVVEARKESFTVRLRPAQAAEAKDALAKAL